MNWREWVFVQSQLGFVSVALIMTHITVKGYAEWLESRDWFEVVQRLSFQSAVIPWITVTLKLILLIPPVNNYVWKIRRGWERRAQQDKKLK